MKKLLLVLPMVALTACLPQTGGPTVATGSGFPVHPDPLCFYDEPFEPGGPLSEVCA